MNLEIRQAERSDIVDITRLFFETIQTINSKDYPQEEIDDWSSWYSDYEKWNAKIIEQYFIVATFDSKIAGFASLATDGYLDLMYVHKVMSDETKANIESNRRVLRLDVCTQRLSGTRHCKSVIIET